MSAEVTLIEREIVIEFEPEEVDLIEDALDLALTDGVYPERRDAIRKLRDEIIAIRRDCRR